MIDIIFWAVVIVVLYFAQDKYREQRREHKRLERNAIEMETINEA